MRRGARDHEHADPVAAFESSASELVARPGQQPPMVRLHPKGADQLQAAERVGNLPVHVAIGRHQLLAQRLRSAPARAERHRQHRTGQTRERGRGR